MFTKFGSILLLSLAVFLILNSDRALGENLLGYPDIGQMLERGDSGAAIVAIAEKWRSSEAEERVRIEGLISQLFPWMSKKDIYRLLSGRILDLREVPSKKILVLLPLNGPLKSLATAFLNGFSLGISRSLQIEVIDISKGLKEARKRITRESPALIVGPLTSQGAFNVKGLSQKNLVPTILPTQYNILLQGEPLLFLFNGGYLLETERIVEFSMDTLGMKNFVSLVPNTALGLSLGKFFHQKVKERGGTVLFYGMYSPNATDFSEFVEKLKGLEEIDGIYLPIATRNSLILASEIRVAEITAPFLGLDSWGGEEARKWSRRGVDSVYVATPFKRSSSIKMQSEEILEEREFRLRYISKFEEDPPLFSKRGYDTARYINRLFSKNGYLSSLSTWDNINRSGPFYGISGRYLISKNKRFIKIFKLSNGILRKIQRRV